MIPMPDGFCWKTRRHLDMLPTGLFLHGEQVASMQQRVNWSWLSTLSPEDGGMPSCRPGCAARLMPATLLAHP